MPRPYLLEWSFRMEMTSAMPIGPAARATNALMATRNESLCTYRESDSPSQIHKPRNQLSCSATRELKIAKLPSKKIATRPVQIPHTSSARSPLLVASEGLMARQGYRARRRSKDAEFRTLSATASAAMFSSMKRPLKIRRQPATSKDSFVLESTSPSSPSVSPLIAKEVHEELTSSPVSSISAKQMDAQAIRANAKATDSTESNHSSALSGLFAAWMPKTLRIANDMPNTRTIYSVNTGSMRSVDAA
mmetsp:Transcript_2687/g.11119  ORF Transcript_2687/g.11119 Transcript_2687/m.11119 type:complete len:248 (+) Transcript_2687:376-1119(+)